MKGLHWGLIVGLVVVVILLLVGSGIAGDIAKFTYTDYTDIKPGGGEGGGIIGGGGLPPSSDILVAERPLSESDNTIYDSSLRLSDILRKHPVDPLFFQAHSWNIDLITGSKGEAYDVPAKTVEPTPEEYANSKKRGEESQSGIIIIAKSLDPRPSELKKQERERIYRHHA